MADYEGLQPRLKACWLQCSRAMESGTPSLRNGERMGCSFSERAAVFTASLICQGRKTVDEVLRDHYIEPLTKLAKSVRDTAARVACQKLSELEKSQDNEWSLCYLRWMTEGVLSDLTSQDAFCHTVSSLILSESARRAESFQRALRHYVQSHKRLGDPRIRESSLNWPRIAPEAAQRYLSGSLAIALPSSSIRFCPTIVKTGEGRIFGCAIIRALRIFRLRCPRRTCGR